MNIYNTIRDELQTGDILLFRGKGFASRIIQSGQRSAGHAEDCAQFSHVGMVYTLGGFDIVLCWESTTLSDIRDITTNTAIKGVMLVPLSERIRRYRGDIAVRRILEDRDPWNLEDLDEFRRKVHGTPYESSRLELALSAGRKWAGAREENLNTIFCSELLAESLQILGFVDDSVYSNDFCPAEFAKEVPPGMEGVELGPVEWIKKMSKEEE